MVIARARLKYLRGSPQKVRLVTDQVRGKSVGDALSILRYSPRLVARDLEKLVQSAVANAQQSDPQIDVDQLVVSRAVVDGGPPLKRIRHRSMGRVFPIIKRTCHVTICLDVSGGDASAGAPAERG